MIRIYQKKDLNDLMQIWLNANMEAHSFIPKEYWISHYDMVKTMLPQAQLYVYEDDAHPINGFIGLMNHYIAGIFVKKEARSKGIGTQLLNYVKNIKPALSLNVYQKNTRAIAFYQREHFIIQSENIDTDTNEKELTMVWENKISTPSFHVKQK